MPRGAKYMSRVGGRSSNGPEKGELPVLKELISDAVGVFTTLPELEDIKVRARVVLH
jgi:hypothetical protein